MEARLLVLRELVEPRDVRVEASVREEREHAGDADRIVDALLGHVRLPEDVEARSAARFEAAFHRRERDRLVFGDELRLAIDEHISHLPEDK